MTCSSSRPSGRACLLSEVRALLICGALFCTQAAQAAIPGRFQDLVAAPDSPDALAASPFSQAKFPEVVDCLLQRRSSENQGAEDKADIHINYPSFGNKLVDDDIRRWVTEMADAFASSASPLFIYAEEPETEAGLTQDAQKNPDPFELWGEYRVSRPSDAAVSVAFELWNYTGNPEGDQDIITLNYSLLTGQRLNLVDIFEKPDVALELMSAWCRKALEARFGPARRAAMLAYGTEPLIENYSSITLTPEGICINFQPWQVAPKDAGIQKVEMPLEELLPSSPLLALWGRENEHAGTD